MLTIYKVRIYEREEEYGKIIFEEYTDHYFDAEDKAIRYKALIQATKKDYYVDDDLEEIHVS